MRLKRLIRAIFGGDKGEINPEDIFIDSSNLPDFDNAQFEGRIEKPFSKLVAYFLMGTFLLVALIFTTKVWNLQVVDGEEFAERSRNNSLRHTTIFSERGSILDRNGKVLVTNTPAEIGNDFSQREYTDFDGLAHVLGYVKYPQKDSSGNYYSREFSGVDGVEKTFDDFLTGENGLKITETNAVGEIASENVITPPTNGQNLHLSIDADLQQKLYTEIRDLSEEVGFKGGAAAFMDIKTGELIALTSYPEYDSQVLTDGDNRAAISQYNQDSRNVYLNRAVSGLYTPGSIIKLFVSIGALAEEIISPTRQILSTGSISIPNPYFPDKPTIFSDWKAHGLVDMREAIAVSSNVYFYEIGGGYQDQIGLGIKRINKYINLFGYGSDTGIKLPNENSGTVPNPEWKERVFPGDPWRVGDTYFTSIGQYGFQVTPVQAVASVTAIANKGTLFTPSLVKDQIAGSREIDVDDSYFEIVQEGMRQAVESGSAGNLGRVPFKVAAKTGTAELGVSKDRVNSWIVGYFPYENPKYSFTVMMESGRRENVIGGLYIALEALNWIAENRQEYLE
jgi:penicillin-binding protein 2